VCPKMPPATVSDRRPGAGRRTSVYLIL